MKFKSCCWFMIAALIVFLPLVPDVSGKDTGKGGSYIGGLGGGRKGSHYSNPATGDHYQKGGFTSRGVGSASHGKASKNVQPSPKFSPQVLYAATVARDQNGHIIRSEAAKEAFLRSLGLKQEPPGYEVDHIIPLYGGGSDTPSNMQLLTVAEHHAKTKADYQLYGR